MPTRGRNYVFAGLGLILAIVVAAALDFDREKKSRRRPPDVPAGLTIPTSAPGVYVLPNSGSANYPQTVAQFFREHAGEDCQFVGDATNDVGRSTWGHYFRCTCPDSDDPPPCREPDVEDAQKVTKE